jgi:D-arabinose 1-dehydrogenase-like Zn-dependent alcohol dehydrogenase
MAMRILHTTGKRDITDLDFDLPPLADDQIKVKTWACGVCRSDVAAYAGWEKPMTLGQQGHEGLGTVVEIGKKVTEVKVGDYVATWSDPAYGDSYYASIGQFVQVPELSKEYILQPTACAINIAVKMKNAMTDNSPLVLFGSGFMSLIIGQFFNYHSIPVIVIGNSHKAEWDKINIPIWGISTVLNAKDKYKYIIDLTSKAETFHIISKHLGDVEAVICYASTPFEPVTTNFFESCWNCHTLIMPSPRNKDFNNMMKLARDFIADKKISVGNYWTKSYDRNDHLSVVQAFEDGVNRPTGYLRGYIQWS